MQTNTSFYIMLKENARRYPDRTAILYDTISVSYRTLFEDVVKKAIHLQHFEGQRIALYGPASYRWIVNMFGTVLAGKDIIVVDSFLPQKVRTKLLAKIGTDYILCSTNQYILSDENAIVIPHAGNDDVEGLEYDENTKEGNILMFTATAYECDKAVVLSTANILNTAKAVSAHCCCDETDRVLAQIPLNHIFGFVYSLLWPISSGACVCVGRGLRHMDADTYYYHPTILPGNPAMIEYLKKIKAFNSELRTIVIGGAACPYRLFECLKDRDFNVYTVYGMTECTGCIAINDSMDGSYELYDSEAVTIAPDGELLVGGACVMRGYDQDEQANRNVLSGGVFHTGDYGHFNNAGRLVLTQRNPGIIQLPTGEKISRNVTNEQITALSGIAESYIGLCNDRLTAVIVPIDREALQERFKRLIDRYNEQKGYRWEIQRVVVLRKALPRLSDGRIDEDAVERILAEEICV